MVPSQVPHCGNPSLVTFSCWTARELQSLSRAGLDDPTATARLDWSLNGFHAHVLSANDTVYVGPYAKGETEYYIVYYKGDARKEKDGFQCFVPGSGLGLGLESVRRVVKQGAPRVVRIRSATRTMWIMSPTKSSTNSGPATTRTMTFRVTVRGNRAGSGGLNSATMQLSVNVNAGPFLVTQPNTALSWVGGSMQTVTWDVANTWAAPVNTAQVRILLSTDGGQTFHTLLTTSTPNDGTEQVLIPNTPTTTARLKVAAVDNIFFDISDANFTITDGSAASSVVRQMATFLLRAFGL